MDYWIVVDMGAWFLARLFRELTAGGRSVEKLDGRLWREVLKVFRVELETFVKL